MNKLLKYRKYLISNFKINFNNDKIYLILHFINFNSLIDKILKKYYINSNLNLNFKILTNTKVKLNSKFICQNTIIFSFKNFKNMFKFLNWSINTNLIPFIYYPLSSFIQKYSYLIPLNYIIQYSLNSKNNFLKFFFIPLIKKSIFKFLNTIYSNANFKSIN